MLIQNSFLDWKFALLSDAKNKTEIHQMNVIGWLRHFLLSQRITLLVYYYERIPSVENKFIQ